MKVNRSFSVLMSGLMISTALLFSGCKKEAGPKGDTGPAGPAGAPGNANVKTVNLTILPNEWVNVTAESSVIKLVPEITADILSKGAVMVYAQEGTNQWIPLPFTYTDESGVVQSWTFMVEPGKITIMVVYNANAVLPPSTFQPSLTFRLALISGPSALVKNAAPKSEPNQVVTPISN